MHSKTPAKVPISSGKKITIGILGGGQLALFLAIAAQKLQYRVLILSEDSNSLWEGLADNSPSEPKKSRFDLAKECDHIIIENEGDTVHFFGEIDAETERKVKPSTDALKILADKGSQKKFLAKHGIASPRFAIFSADGQSPLEWLMSQGRDFPKGFVLKWTRGGYDGLGVTFVRASAIRNSDFDDFIRFMDQGMSRGGNVYAEAFVDYSCELALVATRAATGLMVFYPLVVSEQERGICRRVRGPARTFLKLGDIEERLQQIARRIAEGLELLGTFAIEFFMSKDGSVLVNEIAPRVHNSAHFTLDWDQGSQFDNHIRAISGLELVFPRVEACFAMLNILGPDDYVGQAQAPSLELEGATLYWYGKSQMRPGRKMGHVNLVAKDPETLMKGVEKLEESLLHWSQLMSRCER